MRLVGVALVGLAVGFLGGLLGKGGSAIATPLLHALGTPSIVAVAAPLPATIPSTAIAGYAYWRERFVDWRVATWSIAFGVPFTAAGALATRWIGGDALVLVTDAVLIVLGLRLILHVGHAEVDVAGVAPVPWYRLASVASIVGVVSGLLGNSGGFLLAPLFVTVLRLPIKRALATSLVVSCVLAVPGTVMHAFLGHIDWALVSAFGLTAVPLSFFGARLAMRADARRLTGIYGGVLAVLGIVFLLLH